jgi:hypothetical protein
MTAKLLAELVRRRQPEPLPEPTPDPETLYCIDGLTHPTKFFCGVVVDASGRVIAAAHIVRYMERDRWQLQRVRSYCRSKGWKLSRVCNSLS